MTMSLVTFNPQTGRFCFWRDRLKLGSEERKKMPKDMHVPLVTTTSINAVVFTRVIKTKKDFAGF